MGRTSDAREKLLETAGALFFERGFVDVGVSELCKQADVRPGSFYHFFPSKAALATEALDHVWQRLEAQVLAPAAEQDDPVDRILSVFECSHSRQRSMQDEAGRVLGCPLVTLGGEIYALEPALRRKLAALARRYEQFFAQQLQEAVDQQRIHVDDVEALARTLTALLEGGLSLARMHNDASYVCAHLPAVRALLGGRLLT